ncbi:AAA family ATPase [Methylobacterium oryzihabitans]|uniref:ATP-binding protein n=1 Tax=Methylobacterium oryzihabitans TaxID=2499852 RepID=A0A437NZC4_9HYPH|nr:ATP-binding protein [Methylobacterium oryzihabitans]RVU15344.1 ATP-binding protein [Methylobacterium oryzihabitans]
MPVNDTVLHLVCGKIAAGKSTLTARLGAGPDTILIREDQWLASLYPGEQNSLADYVRNSGRLRSVMGPHLVAVLRTGLSVVLDFPANTPGSRAWMRSLFEEAGVAHRLHYLDVSDEVCKSRLRRRNADGQHEFAVSDEQFDLFTSYFVPPAPEEGFTVVRHPTEGP